MLSLKLLKEIIGQSIIKYRRGRAVVARWAHNPKVGGSNPPLATKISENSSIGRALDFQSKGYGFEARFSL